MLVYQRGRYTTNQTFIKGLIPYRYLEVHPIVVRNKPPIRGNYAIFRTANCYFCSNKVLTNYIWYYICSNQLCFLFFLTFF